MNRVIGVINLSSPSLTLGALTQTRSVDSVPFGGRYRLIDFSLSNMVNAGIRKVAVFTYNHSRSLIDHLGAGKEWDLDRRQGGLFILPPVLEESNHPYKGDLYQLHGHIDYFNRSKEEFVLVAHSNILYNIDYQLCMQKHLEENADITIVYTKIPSAQFDRSQLVYVDVEQSRVKGFQLHADMGSTNSNLYLESFLIRKRTLVELIEAAIAEGKTDLTTDILFNQVHTLHMAAYEHSGHIAVIDSVLNYYKESMKLLHPDIYQSLFFQPGLVYTKIKDEPPTKYLEESNVRGALVANGCTIEGTVENSILFRGVKVGKGAVVKNSIIMQKCVIESGVTVEHAILDKEVLVGQNRVLAGTQLEPIVISKRTEL